MSTPDPQSRPPSYSGVRRFLAGLLMAAGGGLALLCGACTISVALDDPSWAWVAVFGGALGFVPGLGLFFVGRSLWRK